MNPISVQWNTKTKKVTIFQKSMNILFKKKKKKIEECGSEVFLYIFEDIMN